MIQQDDRRVAHVPTSGLPGPMRRWRPWTLLVLGYAVASSVLGALALGLGAQREQLQGPADLDALLGSAAAVLAWALLTWFCFATGWALAAALRDARAGTCRARTSSWVPVAARRLAALLLVAGLAAAGASPAQADRAGPVASAGLMASVGASGERATVELLDRPATVDLDGWTPDRPAPPPRAPRGEITLVSTAPRPHQAAEVDVVVRRGDTLWDIAARHLGPGADAAEIAAEWPRWHDANRELLGSDPDLIVAGMRLRVPA